jgi:hypothetical protein
MSLITGVPAGYDLGAPRSQVFAAAEPGSEQALNFRRRTRLRQQRGRQQQRGDPAGARARGRRGLCRGRRGPQPVLDLPGRLQPGARSRSPSQHREGAGARRARVCASPTAITDTRAARARVHRPRVSYRRRPSEVQLPTVHSSLDDAWATPAGRRSLLLPAGRPRRHSTESMLDDDMTIEQGSRGPVATDGEQPRVQDPPRRSPAPWGPVQRGVRGRQRRLALREGLILAVAAAGAVSNVRAIAARERPSRRVRSGGES